MPPALDGASAIHSAEDRRALFTLALVLNDCPVVTFLIDAVNRRVWGAYCTSADITSPGWIVMVLMENIGCG